MAAQKTEEVAEKYVDFLTAVAKSGNVLSKRVLSRALNDTCEGDRATLDAFEMHGGHPE